MSKKFIQGVVGVAAIVAGVVTGNPTLIVNGVILTGSALTSPKSKTKTADRQAAAASVQLGEVPRQAIFGEAATAGSLVDAFNYGGKYGTDWEVVVFDLADHRCEALSGFYVNDQWVAFAGDGPVAGFNGQLSVWWRAGTEDQSVPDVLLANGPGWTPDDNGAGVCHVTVAYKADAADAKDPIWPSGRPRFLWVVRGSLCYSARADSSVGGAGGQRWDQPSTRTWTRNPIDCRYTWARGLYACDRVGDASQLMIGRGLTAVEAPPANVFHRANLCDESIDGQARYTIGALVDATATYLDVEGDFAAACAGTIVQPQGSVEIDPGEARAVVATITDDDLVVGTRAIWNNGMLGVASADWVNTVVASYVEPTLKWADHAAPVRREVADILADRQPREERLQLGYVTNAAQAGRVAEVRRRLGRLPGRGTITLPPRFASIEEGDWIVWHSPRRFQPRYGVDALTFRVDAWASGAEWHHQLTLRQISASVYSDTAPLDDGSVAILPPAPPPIGAPEATDWTVDAGYQTGSDLRTPVLIVAGRSTDPAARFVRIEYRAEGAAIWTDAGVTGPDVERRELPVGAAGLYQAAVSYVVDGVTGPRLVLGPVRAGSVLYPDGTPVKDRQPAEAGATNSADPASPFGLGGTVGQAAALLAKIDPIVVRSDVLDKAVVDLAAVDRQANRDLARLAERQLGDIVEASRTRTVIRDAGVQVDPVTGKVRIYALDQAVARTAAVEVGLDAVKGQLTLRATIEQVEEIVALAAIDPSQIAELGEIIARINTVEIALDAAEASIAIKADATTVTTIGGSVQRIEQLYDALNGLVATKVSRTEFDAQGQRINSVEQILSTLPDGATSSLTLRTAQRVADSAAVDAFAGIVGNSEERRLRVVAAAEVRSETFARIIDGERATAGRLDTFAANYGAADARAASQIEALAEAGRAISRSQEALGADLGRVGATVIRQGEALATETEARGQAVSQVRAELGPPITEAKGAADAAASAAGAVNQRVTSEVARLDQAVVTETDARSRADQQVRADFDTNLGTLATSTENRIVAAVSAEANRSDQAIARAADAQAISTQAVNARVDGNVASIVQINKVVATPTGATSVSINALDSNGRIIGTKASNDGKLGRYQVASDIFEVVHPTTGEVLFYVDNAGAIVAHLRAKSIETEQLVNGATGRTVVWITTADVVVPSN